MGTGRTPRQRAPGRAREGRAHNVTTTDHPLPSELQALVDRQAIVDCLERCARGIDRLDVDLYRSAFHDDAVDCHGDKPVTTDEFLEMWLPKQPLRDANQHFLTNHTIDIAGDVAHAETYFISLVKLAELDDLELIGGRYVDRFERRAETGWRIALRVMFQEWRARADAAPRAAILGVDWGRRDRTDPSYERPLRPRPLDD